MADAVERESIAKMSGSFLREFGVLYLTFGLLDAQMPSDHLKQFGLYESTQAEYVKHFHHAAAIEASF